MQAKAQRMGLKVEEREEAYRRDFVLVIPVDLLNDCLWELDLQGLLYPTQVITGPPDLHVKLEEKFSTLTWLDANE